VSFNSVASTSSPGLPRAMISLLNVQQPALSARLVGLLPSEPVWLNSLFFTMSALCWDAARPSAPFAVSALLPLACRAVVISARAACCAVAALKTAGGVLVGGVLGGIGGGAGGVDGPEEGGTPGLLGGLAGLDGAGPPAEADGADGPGAWLP
jgi:hypothetical protein